MAVARCCLQRAFTGFSSNISNKFQYLVPESVKSQPLESLLKTCLRPYSNYTSSPFVEDLKGLTDYEVLKSPPEWKYVERLLPFKTVPKPIQKDEYPSGWVPQSPESLNHPYFVSRNKNHMMPVYVRTTFRGMRKISMIRRVQGDIWLLAEELKAYLKSKHQDQIIVLRVHELCGTIEVRRDFVLDIKDFLLNKGF